MGEERIMIWIILYLIIGLLVNLLSLYDDLRSGPVCVSNIMKWSLIFMLFWWIIFPFYLLINIKERLEIELDGLFIKLDGRRPKIYRKYMRRRIEDIHKDKEKIL